MNSVGLPSWLIADLRRLQPSVAGSAPVAQVFVAVLHAAGVTTTVDAEESARAMIRVNEVPVTPLGALDMQALHREVDLASDYVAAFPADGFDARKASCTVREQAHLVAALTGDRACLIYARNAALARSSANLDTITLLSRVAAAELQMGRAEMRHEQALSAAAGAWSGLRESSEQALRLKLDLERLTADLRRQQQNAHKLVDAMALAERLLCERGEDYVSVVAALGLFRKRRTDEHRATTGGGSHRLESLADIAALLHRARADWGVLPDLRRDGQGEGGPAKG
jgi:hypothetical protein